MPGNLHHSASKLLGSTVAHAGSLEVCVNGALHHAALFHDAASSARGPLDPALDSFRHSDALIHLLEGVARGIDAARHRSNNRERSCGS
ncbi:MAG: hypothetical protein K0U84_15110 [Actinomycetia bacterium]|nr:hypothetical protein [Actinomycetes bacterium]